MLGQLTILGEMHYLVGRLRKDTINGNADSRGIQRAVREPHLSFFYFILGKDSPRQIHLVYYVVYIYNQLFILFPHYPELAALHGGFNKGLPVQRNFSPHCTRLLL